MNPRRRKRRSSRRRRRHNPFRRRYYARRHNEPNPRRRKRRGTGLFRTLGETAVVAAWAIGGGIVTRALPQMLMKASNTGILGYGANLATALVSSLLLGFVSPAASQGVLIGGLVAIGQRLISDTMGPKVMDVGMSGDLDFDLGLSFYLPNTFPLPTTGYGPYLLQPGQVGSPMAAGGIPGVSPVAQITPAPGALTPMAPGAPAVVPDEPSRWGSRWAV